MSTECTPKEETTVKDGIIKGIVIDTSTLIQHLKDDKGPVATIVAVKGEDGEIYFGYSKYNRTRETKPFTKKLGRELAITRALMPKAKKERSRNVPFIIADNFPNFLERCQRYFKMDRSIAGALEEAHE